MKALFVTIALTAALALWGSGSNDGSASLDHVMVASQTVAQQIYNIVH